MDDMMPLGKVPLIVFPLVALIALVVIVLVPQLVVGGCLLVWWLAARRRRKHRFDPFVSEMLK